VFKNRTEAAKLLGETLAEYRGYNPLVLGIPRGGVVMAGVIAEALDGEVDVVLVHKLGAPGQPEFAIGSVDERAETYLGNAVDRLGIPASYIEEEKGAQVAALKKRRALYTPVHPPINPGERIAIVVDDGLATGSTMIAALHAVRSRRPKKLVAAAAVSPPDTLERIASVADDVVCLEVPSDFYAVGQFFADFGQVEDREVVKILKGSRTPD